MGNFISYNNCRSPLIGQLRPGQHRAIKYNVPRQTTIINNNIFGTGYAAPYHFNYNQPDFCCHDTTPKWMNWMMGIGLGTSFLGGILSLFGGEKGGAPVQTTQNTQPQEDLTWIRNLYEGWTIEKNGDTYFARNEEGVLHTAKSTDELIEKLQSETKPTGEPTGEPVPENTVDHEQPSGSGAPSADDDGGDAFDWSSFDLSNFSAFDETRFNQIGDNSTIRGTTEFKYGEKGSNEAPKSIEITTKSGKTFTFELQDGLSEDGNPQYKATTVTVNGVTHKVTNNQIYELDPGSNRLEQMISESNTEAGLGSAIQWGTSSSSSNVGGGAKIDLNGWYRAANANNSDYEGRFASQDIRDAEDPAGYVADQLIKQWQGKRLTDAANNNIDYTNVTFNKELLKQEIIKRNPSVFESDGKVKANADFSRLDIPTGNWLANVKNTPDGGPPPPPGSN